MLFVYHSYKLPFLPSLPHRADGDAIDRLPQPRAPFAAALGASLARPVLPLRCLPLRCLPLRCLALILVVALSAFVDVTVFHPPIHGKLAERLPLLAGVAFLVCLHVVVDLSLPAQSTFRCCASGEAVVTFHSVSCLVCPRATASLSAAISPCAWLSSCRTRRGCWAAA